MPHCGHLQMSKFKTDFLALPETVAAANEAAKTALDALEKQSLPPTAPTPPDTQPGASSAAADADDFLGAALGTPAVEAPPEGRGAPEAPEEAVQGGLESIPVLEDERPIDIFKAIFEDGPDDESDDGEDDTDKDGAAGGGEAPAQGTEAAPEAAGVQDATPQSHAQQGAVQGGVARAREGAVQEGVARVHEGALRGAAPAEAVDNGPSLNEPQGVEGASAAQRQKLLDALELLRRAKKEKRKKKKSKKKSKKESSKKESSKKKKERRDSSDDSDSDD